MIRDSDLRAARRALGRAILLYWNDPNVSLIDIGWRVYDRKNYRRTDELCVRVHLRRKLRGEAFEAFKRRHPEQVINPDLIEYAVDVPGEADYRAEQWPGSAWGQPPSARRQFQNPLRGGVSVSNAWLYDAGTLGALVGDARTGQPMMLSNWHVLYGAVFVRDGAPVTQPGRLDGGYPTQAVGYLSRHALDQKIDAAVAYLSGSRALVNDLLDIGPITGVAEPQLGMRVVKSGRTTEVTTGEIGGLPSASPGIAYSDGLRRVMHHVFTIYPVSETDSQLISGPGDSGSVWVDEETRQAVGLHFASGEIRNTALAISMPAVVNALGINLPAWVTAMPSTERKPRASLPRPTPEMLARGKRAVESLFAQFGQHPEVSHIDFGYRLVKGRPAPDFALRIHVRRQEWDGAGPDMLGFPSDVEGLPVVLVFGDYRAGARG